MAIVIIIISASVSLKSIMDGCKNAKTCCYHQKNLTQRNLNYSSSLLYTVSTNTD